MLFVCPICNKQLNIDSGKRAVCPSGHSFDKSRKGYYNLLVGRGGAHGDNREMVLARRAFLARGFYEPLASFVAESIASLIGEGSSVLDAGCGEGYYTSAIKRAVEKKGATVSAFDISKDAVTEAARKGAADDYAVCGSYHMPIASGSVDALVNTFSPLAIEETRRVIKTGGHFVMAIPGEEHLFGLKSAVYKTPYKNTVEDTFIEGFKLISKNELRYEMKLDNGGLSDLFLMTPYAYRTRPEDKERVLTLPALTTEAHFYVLIYERTEDDGS